MHRKLFRRKPQAVKDVEWQTVEQGLGEKWGYDDHVSFGNATPQAEDASPHPPQASTRTFIRERRSQPGWPLSRRAA